MKHRRIPQTVAIVLLSVGCPACSPPGPIDRTAAALHTGVDKVAGGLHQGAEKTADGIDRAAGKTSNWLRGRTGGDRDDGLER